MPEFLDQLIDYQFDKIIFVPTSELVDSSFKTDNAQFEFNIKYDSYMANMNQNLISPIIFNKEPAMLTFTETSEMEHGY
jgi:hypothetical protein